MTVAERHLTEAALVALARDPKKRLPAAQRHLESCRRCRQELTLRRVIGEGMNRPGVTSCPDGESLYLIANGATASDEVARHVSRCLPCAVAIEDLGGAARALAPMTARPAPSHRVLASLKSGFRALVDFEMPTPLLVETRGAEAGSPAYRAGLVAYEAGRYGVAERRLRAARAAGLASADVAFLLGACRLRAGKPAEGRKLLEEAVAALPRLGEYHYYLTQALLLEGNGEQARVHARKAERLPGPYRRAARDLRAAIDAVLAGRIG